MRSSALGPRGSRVKIPPAGAARGAPRPFSRGFVPAGPGGAGAPGEGGVESGRLGREKEAVSGEEAEDRCALGAGLLRQAGQTQADPCGAWGGAWRTDTEPPRAAWGAALDRGARGERKQARGACGCGAGGFAIGGSPHWEGDIGCGARHRTPEGSAPRGGNSRCDSPELGLRCWGLARVGSDPSGARPPCWACISVESLG